LGWGFGSSGKAPACQVQGPEFKLQYCKRKKRKNYKIIAILYISLYS
jgi:hypothetical protein